jgi:hypothetical protein
MAYEEMMLRRAFGSRQVELDLTRVLLDLPNPKEPDLSPLARLVERWDAPWRWSCRMRSSRWRRSGCVYARGLRVPEDVAIAAVADHTPQSHPVPLTAMNAAKAMGDVAAAASQQLVRLLDEGQSEQASSARGITLPVQVEWKASTGPRRQDVHQQPQSVAAREEPTSL